MDSYRKPADKLSSLSTLAIDDKYYSYHGLLHERYRRFIQGDDYDGFSNFLDFQSTARDISNDISDELLFSFGMDDLPLETDDNAFVTHYLRNTIADMASLALSADKLQSKDFEQLSGFILYLRKEVANEHLQSNRVLSSDTVVTPSQSRLAMTLKHSAPFLEPFQNLLRDIKESDKEESSPLSRHMKRKVSSALMAILYVNWLQKKAGVKVTGLSSRHKRNMVGMIKGMNTFRVTGIRLNKMPRFLNRLNRDVSRLLKAATRLSPALAKELGYNFSESLSPSSKSNTQELEIANTRLSEQNKLIEQQRYDMARLENQLVQEQLRYENLQYQYDQAYQMQQYDLERQRQLEEDRRRQQELENGAQGNNLVVSFVKKAIMFSLVASAIKSIYGSDVPITPSELEMITDDVLLKSGLDQALASPEITIGDVDIAVVQSIVGEVIEDSVDEHLLNKQDNLMLGEKAPTTRPKFRP